jgi:diguanylate cyclase (GGDEF)-like protein
LNRAIGTAQRAGESLSLLYIDLDHFKEVNDTHGHFAGDELLKMAAERLLSCVRGSDTISRQGGDEFLVLLISCGELDASTLCAQKIVDACSLPFCIDDKELRLSASIGVAMYPADAMDARGLVRAADTAMYEAKCAGGAKYERFSSLKGRRIQQIGS